MNPALSYDGSMGLDATIYCDCFEQGRLRVAPPSEWKVYVDADGGRNAPTKSLEEDVTFDKWNDSASEHDRGILLHHRIGSIGEVALLRKVLSRQEDRFPMIFSRVIYDGMHAGDLITADQIPAIEPELRALSDFHSDTAVEEEYIRHFESQLRELVSAAIRLKKPISF